MIQFFPPVKLDKAENYFLTFSNLSLTLEHAVTAVSLNVFK